MPSKVNGFGGWFESKRVFLKEVCTEDSAKADDFAGFNGGKQERR